jgi:hypothetical protein
MELNATESAPPHAPPQRMPLFAWLALAVMLATVAGVGYLLYGRLFGGAGESRDLVDIIPGRGLPGGIAPPRVQPDGVRELGSNSHQVKAGDARVNVRRDKAGAEWTYNFSYQRRDLLTPEIDAALTARWRLPRDARFAASLGVTPEQIKRLDEVPGREGMIVSEADRARVKGLFEAYLNASPPREAETTALVNALREIGDRSLEPTRAAMADRAAKVQGILTPEQIAKFRRPGN